MDKTDWDRAKSQYKLDSKIILYPSNWLNGCCHELVKPSTPLDKVTSKIMAELATKLEKSLPTAGSETTRQAVYSLLGYPYVSDNFPKAKYDKLFLSNLSDIDRRHATASAQSYLDESLNRIIEKFNYDKPLTRYSAETPLGSFLRDSKVVFEAGIESHLREGKRMKVKVESKERAGRSVTLEEGESNMWDNRTDIVAQALVEIGKHEPHRIPSMLHLFRERHCPLPSPFRYLVMTKFLFGKEKPNYANGMSVQEIESAYQENFIQMVHQNTTSLNVDRAIRSPIWRDIDNAVIEVYGRVPLLRLYDADEHQIEAARVLNILHVYNKTFDSTLVLWLFPVQLMLDYSVKGTDSHVMKLAMLFDLTIRHCIPTPSHIFAMAQEVVTTWRNWDSKIYDHVRSSLQKSVWLNAKDFPHQTIHPNISEANKILVKLKSHPRGDLPPDHLAVFVDPAIFIRKWIAEGFAGVLSHRALLYIWDELFFNDWNRQTIRDVCLAILLLLGKNRFLQTKNYFGVREVLLTDPGRLYTTDIIKAYSSVQREDSFDNIPKMNRNYKDKV